MYWTLNVIIHHLKCDKVHILPDQNYVITDIRMKSQLRHIRPTCFKHIHQHTIKKQETKAEL